MVRALCLISLTYTDSEFHGWGSEMCMLVCKALCHLSATECSVSHVKIACAAINIHVLYMYFGIEEDGMIATVDHMPTQLVKRTAGLSQPVVGTCDRIYKCRVIMTIHIHKQHFEIDSCYLYQNQCAIRSKLIR